jgi:hypothetical protein
VDTRRAYKSFRYKAETAWSSARRGTLSALGKPNIVVGSPPEFKGQPDIWAPEELSRVLCNNNSIHPRIVHKGVGL